MTGCEILSSYCMLIISLGFEHLTPLDRLKKAYQLRTRKKFDHVIKRDGTYGNTIHRGLLFYILRYDYRYNLRNLCDLAGYLSHQPIYRCISAFESELTVNPTLRRDYESIRAMLSI